MPGGLYAIGELADLGGISRRTIRYYVQEGLLPPPLGLGRGNHYGREQLDRPLQGETRPAAAGPPCPPAAAPPVDVASDRCGAGRRGARERRRQAAAAGTAAGAGRMVPPALRGRALI